MAFTEIDGQEQIQNLSIPRGKLLADFLEGANLNLTNGNNDATITGLANGIGLNDAVNKGQMDAAIAAAVTGAMSYQGTIDASDASGAALDGAAIGDFFIVTTAGTLDGIDFQIGDHLVVNSAITDFSVDGSGKIDKIDNTEADDILRSTDVVNDLTTGGTDVPLSAQQGVVLKGLIDGLQTDFNERVFSEKLATTVGSPTLAAIANTPVNPGTLRVYWNGIRAEEGAGNDYTVNLVTGVITMGKNMKSKDKVIVDYEY
jgi:hypothetical protein